MLLPSIVMPMAMGQPQVPLGQSAPETRSSGPVLGTPAEGLGAAPVPIASIAEVISPATSAVRSEETEVPVPPELQSLLEHGGEPSTIDELRLLEKQTQLIAAKSAACTVSVQIGPAQGCGVIITESGYILTAAHVAMRPGKTARVTLSNGRMISAKTLGMNRRVDAGLMKIDPGQNGGLPWPHATLGKSDHLTPGMWCVAAGHPGGYDASRGPVARVGRILRTRLGAIETDCALIGGDSGGPLFDIAGRLIAVHSRIGNDVTENLHVPIDFYGTSWEKMQSGQAWGFLPGFRPVIGVRGPSSSSVIVYPDSPAAKAGIKSGDSIDQFGDVVIRNFEDLKKAVADTMPGERVPVWISRNGSSYKKTIEIGRDE
jgi:serine protease Do